jgi:hypothetical protein
MKYGPDLLYKLQYDVKRATRYRDGRPGQNQVRER